MKVTADNKNGFTPVSATIVLQTQKEVDALCNLCNHATIVDAMDLVGLDILPIRDGLDPHATRDSFASFHNKVKHLIG